MIQENILQKLHHSLVEERTIFSVESIIVALIAQGVPSENIIIHNAGSDKRAFRKIVTGFHTESALQDLNENIYLHTSNEGLYDFLPQHIFHQPSLMSDSSGKYEAIAEIAKSKAEEKNARKFFLPFDDVITKSKSSFYKIQEDFETNIYNSKLIAVFSRQWPILNKLDSIRAYAFLRIIPLIHDIRDDFDSIPIFVKTILDIPIHCSLQKRLICIEPNDGFNMGSGKLGEDMVIGMEVDDGEMDVVLTIGPLNDQQIQQYAPGGNDDKLLDELLDYVIGANYFIYKEIVPEGKINHFTLDDDAMLLGLNAVL